MTADAPENLADEIAYYRNELHQHAHDPQYVRGQLVHLQRKLVEYATVVANETLPNGLKGKAFATKDGIPLSPEDFWRQQREKLLKELDEGRELEARYKDVLRGRP
jgi:hypothetical protein